MELYNELLTTVMTKAISFDKLVTQTYDGASNMTGCYNGLQAIINTKFEEYVAFVHSYLHTLNLVLSDSTGVAVQVISPFNNLEALYVLVSKSQRIHGLFETVQQKENRNMLSLKILMTVRWICVNFF